MKIPAPSGYFYANDMVDKPYTRFSITDDVQNQIVPAIVSQER